MMIVHIFKIQILMHLCQCSKNRSFKVLTPINEEEASGRPVVFWDLDQTLYSQKTGIYSDALVLRYMMERMEMGKDLAMSLFEKYQKKFSGQVIQGLADNFNVDPDEFEAWIDAKVDLRQVLKNEKQAAFALQNSASRNWIFTNSGWAHANRLIKALHIKPFIEGVIFLNYKKGSRPVLKPNVEAFYRAMKYAKIKDGKSCYLVDDVKANTKGACAAGWNSVHFCDPLYCTMKRSVNRLLPRSDTDQCRNIPNISRLDELYSVFPELIVP